MVNCLSPTPHDVDDVGQPMADMKVIQKCAKNLKIMLLAVQLLQAADNVSQANHTCIIRFTYVYATPYKLKNLILML